MAWFVQHELLAAAIRGPILAVGFAIVQSGGKQDRVIEIDGIGNDGDGIDDRLGDDTANCRRTDVLDGHDAALTAL